MIKDYGLVSIIMPAFNSGQSIRDSVRSVLSQTYENWELIVVDNCSTDNTVALIKEFSDPRIHLFLNDKNHGPAFSRNVALAHTAGEWVAFLDSDDLWVPEKLSEQLAFMVSNGFAFSYSNYLEVNEKGKLTGTLITGPSLITPKIMNHLSYPGCLTVMYKKAVCPDVYIDPRISKVDDDCMWLQVVEKADCHLFPKVLGFYRRTPASFSRVSKAHLLICHYYLYKYGKNYSFLRAWFHAFVNGYFYVLKRRKYVKHVLTSQFQNTVK